jgi:hypothetical protein
LSLSLSFLQLLGGSQTQPIGKLEGIRDGTPPWRMEGNQNSLASYLLGTHENRQTDQDIS